MTDALRFVVGLTADIVRRRAGLVADNALLRQQLIVAQRKIAGRVRWAPWQRFTMGLAAGIAPAWRDATLLVQPATILRWHRAGKRIAAERLRCGQTITRIVGRGWGWGWSAHPRVGWRRDEMRGIFDSEGGWSGLPASFARAAAA